MAVLLMLTALAVEARADIITIDSRETYLRTNVDVGALDAIAIELITLGLSSGDLMTLTRVGDFDCGPPCTDTIISMIAVFSSSDTLLASTQAHRVPGAINAGDDNVTLPTFFGALPTDIPEDFFVPGTGVKVTIPTGATYLFVTARDVLYHDNTDPDRDFAVSIEQVTPAVPEPVTLLLLVPGIVGLGLRWRAHIHEMV